MVVPRYSINQEARKYTTILRVIERDVLRYIEENYEREDFYENFKSYFTRKMIALSLVVNSEIDKSVERFSKMGIKDIANVTETSKGVNLNDEARIKVLRSVWSDGFSNLLSKLEGDVNIVINDAKVQFLKRNEVTKRVKDIFKNQKLDKETGVRGRRILTNILGMITTLGVLAYAKIKYEREKDSGLIVANKWRSIPDKRRCPICEKLEGQVKRIGAPFKVTVKGKSYETLFPPIHFNCRCDLIAIRKREFR